LEGIEVILGSLRRGVALMFYPEANVLMRPQIDAESGTPAYKRVPVLVRGMARETARSR
jgi:formylmethanofuran dehydrogenase subunit D